MSIEWDNAEAKNNYNTNKQLIQQQQQQQKRKQERLSSPSLVIGQPVDFFSDDLAVDRKIKLASSLGSDLSPSHQRLLLELPKDEDKVVVVVADFIIDSYNQQNISTQSALMSQPWYISQDT